jgi:hypothetical protein
MWNFYQQPYTLIAIGMLALSIVSIIRPEKKLMWLWLLPFAIAGLGLLLDRAVETDPELIKGTIKQAVKAAENEDIAAISNHISEDYRDSFHASKAALLNHAQNRLSQPLISKTFTQIGKIQMRGSTATVPFSVKTTFDPQSAIREYREIAMFTFEATLAKEAGVWRFTSIEVRKVDLSDASWNQVQ